MSTRPYQRRQGEFELRILKDGRLVLIAPDEALLEMAKAFASPAEEEKVEHPHFSSENQHGETREPQGCPPAG